MRSLPFFAVPWRPKQEGCSVQSRALFQVRAAVYSRVALSCATSQYNICLFSAWHRVSMVSATKDGTLCCLEASVHGLEVYPLRDRLLHLHSVGARVRQNVECSSQGDLCHASSGGIIHTAYLPRLPCEDYTSMRSTHRARSEW